MPELAEMYCDFIFLELNELVLGLYVSDSLKFTVLVRFAVVLLYFKIIGYAVFDVVLFWVTFVSLFVFNLDQVIELVPCVTTAT